VPVRQYGAAITYNAPHLSYRLNTFLEKQKPTKLRLFLAREKKLSGLNLLDLRWEKVGIFLMAKRQPGQGNNFGFIVRAGVMNAIHNMSHGITHDLAFGPAERGGQSL